MIRKIKCVAMLGLFLLLSTPSFSLAYDFAVWMDGQTTDGGNPIATNLATLGSATLVTTAQLDTPGFLNSFDAVVLTRFASNFGTSLDATAASNVSAYVGSGATQGGVAVFTNDLADNLFGATTGDPYDANLQALFMNAANFAAQSGHGFIGEFNGAVMAMASNSAGFASIGLLPGSAGAPYFYGQPFIYDVGPIGASNQIDAGVTFPFTDIDLTTFRTDITGAASSNIVDVYHDNGLPAVLANDYVISGGGTPVPEPSAFLLFGAGLAGVAFLRRKLRR